MNPACKLMDMNYTLVAWNSTSCEAPRLFLVARKVSVFSRLKDECFANSLAALIILKHFYRLPKISYCYPISEK